jgi:hypothetical protein
MNERMSWLNNKGKINDPNQSQSSATKSFLKK